VVGRFVEDQKVERFGQQGGEEQAAFLSAGQDLDTLFHVVALKQEGGAEVAYHSHGGHGQRLADRFKHGPFRVENVHGVLTEIAPVDVGADGHRTGTGFGLAGQHLEEGRFAGAIHPGHGDLLAAPDQPGYAAEDRLFAPFRSRPSLGQVPHQNHVVAAARRFGEFETDGFLLRRQLDAFDLLQFLDPRLHLGRMGGAGREAGNEVFLLGQHLLLAAMAGQELFPADFPLPQVKIIIAAIGGDGLIADLDDPRHQPVHEFAVMAGHQHRALEVFGQPALQPDDGLDVQMVGRLVKEQHVGIQGQDFRQGNAHLPAAAEGFHRSVMGLRADAEAGQYRLGAAFEMVAVAMLEFFLGIAIALQQRRQRLVRHGLAHGRFHLGDLPTQFHGACRSGHDLGEGRATGHLAYILGKIANDGFSAAADLAAVHGFFAGNQAENSGFAGAVGSHQATARAGGDLKTGILEKDLRAVLFGNMGQVNHETSLKVA